MRTNFKALSKLWTTLAILGACVAPAAITQADYSGLNLSRVGMRVLSPLDGTWFDGGDFEFGGEAFSNWEVTPQLLNKENGEWFDIPDQVSAFTYDGFPDSPDRTDFEGIQWFKWHASANWPYYSALLAGPIVLGDNQQRGAPIELRFVNKNTGDGSIVPYSHFGQDGPQCLSDHQSEDATSVMNECALAKDSITYYFKCGGTNQACCAGTDQPCDGDLACTNNSCQAKASPPPAPPPPPPPPTPQGVWYEAGCECTDGYNYNYGAVACCGQPAAAGFVPNAVFDAACSSVCENSYMSLTEFESYGPQSNLGTCNPDASQCHSL